MNLTWTEDELARAYAFLEDGCSYEEAAESVGHKGGATRLRTTFPGMGMTTTEAGELRSAQVIAKKAGVEL